MTTHCILLSGCYLTSVMITTIKKEGEKRQFPCGDMDVKNKELMVSERLTALQDPLRKSGVHKPVLCTVNAANSSAFLLPVPVLRRVRVFCVPS